MEDKKNIEVVSGDGTNLDISPVYEHIDISKPKTTDEKPKNIIIPKENKKDDCKNEDEDTDEGIG